MRNAMFSDITWRCHYACCSIRNIKRAAIRVYTRPVKVYCIVWGSQRDLTSTTERTRMCVLSCLGVNRFSYYWGLNVRLEIWSCRVYARLLKLVWIAETMCSYLAWVTAWSFQWGFYARALAELYLDVLPLLSKLIPSSLWFNVPRKILWMNPTQITWPLGHLISWV